MNAKKSRFEGLFQPKDNQLEEERSQEIKESIILDYKKSRKQESPVPRVKTNYEIRQDYVQALKRIAVDEQRKIYEVIEEAIDQYLKQHQESKA
jgi:beta-mannanase